MKKKTGRSDDFPQGTGCTPGFFRMSASTKLKCVCNNSSPDRKKKLNEKVPILHFTKATFTCKEFPL